MATKKQKIQVGVFLLAGFLLIAVGISVISGMIEKQGVPYFVEFDESILGLNENSIVEYLGVPVGKVSTIWVTPEKKAHVRISIDPDKVTLQEGVQAKLVLYSIAAGTMAISLGGGDPELPTLPPGSEIPARSSTFTAISGEIEELMQELTSIASSVNSGLQGLEEGQLAQLIENADSVLSEGRTLLTRGSTLLGESTTTLTDVRADAMAAIEDFRTLGADLRELSQSAGSLIEETNRKVADLDIATAEENLNEVLENLGNLTGRLDTAVSRYDALSENVAHDVDNIEHNMGRALEDLREAFEGVNTFVEELREDPASVIRGRARRQSGE